MLLLELGLGFELDVENEMIRADGRLYSTSIWSGDDIGLVAGRLTVRRAIGVEGVKNAIISCGARFEKGLLPDDHGHLRHWRV